MEGNELQLTLASLKTELASYEDKPYKCLFEYIWNSFDAGATNVSINFQVPKSGIGDVKEISIEDNGKGWDFEKEKNTKIFLSSSKLTEKKENKSLPRGKYGRGRYVFIWFAESLEIFSLGKRLPLNKNTEVVFSADTSSPVGGTKILIHGPTRDFSNSLISSNLAKELISEFCWFLKENPAFSIVINGQKIDYESNIKKELILNANDFKPEFKQFLGVNFQANLVLWHEKPAEWSNFYFIDEQNNEIFRRATGMNKKKDNFWHSAYIKSDFFVDGILEEDDPIEDQLDLGEKEKRRVKKGVVKVLKEKLTELRKPYLTEQSEHLISELKSESAIPSLDEFGIYDNQAYEDLLKTVYTISPSLFVGKDKKEKRFICATFAGLLSIQDNNLIQIILQQLQDLTEDEKKYLTDVLQRTSLSSIVRTIKEVDHRLQIIDNLEKLLFDYKKQTLEVKHLQKVLNENFWIFGEQFRLFSNTEGSLKKVLYDYAKNILKIDNPDIITDSRKEVDLFLVKTEPQSESHQRNIIVELKRPSSILGKKEYDQIEEYSIKIMKESICNGNNIYWEFYLVGDDYDDYILTNKIENAKNHGEIKKGLTSSVDSGRIKIYVRKWSDILQVEWGFKMKFLKEKLKIEARSFDHKNPADLVRAALAK
jgi:hypothetical protein